VAKAAKSQPVEQGKSPSTVVQIIVLVAMTLFAAGAGWAVSMYLDGLTNNQQAAASSTDAAPGTEEQTSAEHGPADADAAGHGEAGDASAEDDKADRITNLVSVDLQPIITNLSSPAEAWIRLELTVQFNGTPADDVVQQINQDLLAFVRTLKLEHVSGPSGYLHLKSDLADIAAIRSQGLAKAVLIRVMLFE
jgi:flagellar protein FliL